MTRRSLFLIITGVLSTRPSRAEPTWKLGNAFTQTYNEWANLRNARVNDPLTVNNVSVPEFLAWHRLKSAWRALDKSVEADYRPR